MAVTVLKSPNYPQRLKLDAIRLLQVSLGDLGPAPGRPSAFDGYAAAINLERFERELDPLRVELADLFPSGDAQLDDELIRLFAMLTTYNPKVIDAMCDRLTDESDPVEDIHRLVALARCPMTHTVKQRDKIVLALVRLEQKITDRKLPQDASWADRMKEIWLKLALADQFIAPAIVGHPQFGRPGHTIFLNQMPPELLSVARNAFVKVIGREQEFHWTNDVIFALGDSEDPTHRDLIRQQLSNFSVRGAALVVLSRKPDPKDRNQFVAGLAWSQSEVQAACLTALENLGGSGDPDEQIALVKALRRLGSGDLEFAARERVVALLERNNKTSFPFEKGKAGYRPQPDAVAKWTKWAESRFPKEAAAELGGTEVEFTQLKRFSPKQTGRRATWLVAPNYLPSEAVNSVITVVSRWVRIWLVSQAGFLEMIYFWRSSFRVVMYQPAIKPPSSPRKMASRIRDWSFTNRSTDSCFETARDRRFASKRTRSKNEKNHRSR